jgi:hypothetical protein
VTPDAQPITRYAEGDNDPTRPLALKLKLKTSSDLCGAWIDQEGPRWDIMVMMLGLDDARQLFAFTCTWPADHTHPQHVAGGSNGKVLGVSDV